MNIYVSTAKLSIMAIILSIITLVLMARRLGWEYTGYVVAAGFCTVVIVVCAMYLYDRYGG